MAFTFCELARALHAREPARVFVIRELGELRGHVFRDAARAERSARGYALVEALSDARRLRLEASVGEPRSPRLGARTAIA